MDPPAAFNRLKIGTSHSAPELPVGTRHTKLEYVAEGADNGGQVKGGMTGAGEMPGRLIKSSSKKSVLFDTTPPSEDEEQRKQDLNKPISRASTPKRYSRPSTPGSRLSQARNSLDSQLASIHSLSPPNSPSSSSPRQGLQRNKPSGGGGGGGGGKMYAGGMGASMSHSLTSLHRRPLRVLCLDGGGVRGLSSLLILKKLMERIEDLESPFSTEKGFLGLSRVDEASILEMEKQSDGVKGRRGVARPCDWFDLICGTSTGGLIAIMLGRLSMTVDQCINAYIKLSSKVFSSSRTILTLPYASSRFSGSTLESAIKSVIRSSQPPTSFADSARDLLRKVTEDPGDMVLKEEGEGGCKTFVLAAYQGSAGGTVKLFRSYDSSKDRGDECAIWQAGRATSAAPTFFPPVTFAAQLGGPEITYVDAGLGHNNPTEAAIIECEDAFPGRPIGLVLSIGTGRQPDMRLNPGCFSFLPVATQLRVAMACVSISTGVEQVDQRVARHPTFTQGGGKYIRLNVDRAMEGISLEEWRESGQIATATDIYLHAFSTGLLLNDAVNTLRRLTYRNNDIFIPAKEAVGCSHQMGETFQVGKSTWLEEGVGEIKSGGEEWWVREGVEMGSVLTCQSVGVFDLRILCKIPHGRYSVSYMILQSDENQPDLKSQFDKLPDITLTAGRPFDARSFALRTVSRVNYKEIATQLIRPPFDRTVISSLEWSDMKRNGHLSVRAGCEVMVELDGYIAFVVETGPVVELTNRRFSFGGFQGIHLQHVDW